MNGRRFLKKDFGLMLLMGSLASHSAATESDISIIISDDARSHLFIQTMRDIPTDYVYTLPDKVDKKQVVMVNTADDRWELEGNTLRLSGNHVSLMYRHRFDESHIQQEGQHYLYTSPKYQITGGYDVFSLTWIAPDNMKVVDYSSNSSSATWHQSDNVLHFRSEELNGIQLTVKFRKKIGQQHAEPAQDQLETPDEPEPVLVTQMPTTEATRCAEETARPSFSGIFCGDAMETVLNTINFERNSASLTPDVRAMLDDLVPWLNDSEDLFEVAAYTDSKGPQKWNERLSEERAQTVRLYLIYKGVTAAKLVAKGYGEQSPIASNQDAEGRARNRRVVLRRILTEN